MVLHTSFLKLNVVNNFVSFLIFNLVHKNKMCLLVFNHVYDFIFTGNLRGHGNGIYKGRSGIPGL